MSTLPSERERQWLLEEKYGGNETAAFLADLARLEAGEPLAYLIGHTPFLGLSIDLSSHPLIPRAETEYWVDRAISALSNMKEARASFILDLFCGSGCIGAAVLERFPEARADFGDIEPAHFASIRNTLEKNRIDASRARFFETDVFSGIPEDARYDAIFANPPYLSSGRTGRIGESVLAHEPYAALFAEEDGMGLIRRAVLGAAEHLTPGGELYLEHDDWQGEAVQAAFAASGFGAIETWDDQYGLPRVTMGVASKRD